ncbi:siderophore-interacting protein [Streptomyces sp. NPDC048301]|uniref:siderophore-interacting protein n=1 Tax=unclassified Streptomyces TaxID=2593676 RepID=UPI0034448454
MAKTSRLQPTNPGLFRGDVLGSERFSPSIQRVTITGAGLGDFPWLGYDHWFRLFLRLPHQTEFVLPEVSGSRWWEPYLAIPEDVRPHCANYTVADFRPEKAQMDIDFVVHCGPDGKPEGAAAIWACAARPGDPVAVLDQGLIFARPDDATEVLVVADESGLPSTAGILRSLPRDTVGRVIQEIPLDGDRRPLEAPAGVDVTWVVRDDTTAVPGTAALEELRRHGRVDASGYAFIVGESTLAAEGRRHVVRAGLPKDRVTFSGFWKSERKREAVGV